MKKATHIYPNNLSQVSGERLNKEECADLTAYGEKVEGKVMVKIFGTELPDDCEKAIKELKKLRVYSVMDDDYIDNFADVWFRVQHECDMYEEGEESNELSYQSYIGASNWLDRWRDLYYEYEDK